jgi:uncharacterized protein (DUF58 family)
MWRFRRAKARAAPLETAPETIPPEILRQVRRIEIRARRAVQEALAGGYHSVFRGRGMEFEEVREYVPGDDIRAIDWNVTARMGHPFVKRFREERELTVFFLVDRSASLRFGSGPREKGEAAAEACAALAFSAIRNNDKVGLVLFTREPETFVPARKGRAHALRVVREVLFRRPRGTGTSLAAGLEFLGRVARRRAVVFLVSDFLDDGWEHALRVASRRHEIVALTLTDPREQELVPAALVTLEDAETGELRLVDTSDARGRAAFADGARRRADARRRRLLSMGVDEIVLRSDGDLVTPIVGYFRARERRA